MPLELRCVLRAVHAYMRVGVRRLPSLNFSLSVQPISVEDEIMKMRCDLAAAYRMCHKFGLNEGVCNHLTAVVPGKYAIACQYMLLMAADRCSTTGAQ